MNDINTNVLHDDAPTQSVEELKEKISELVNSLEIANRNIEHFESQKKIFKNLNLNY